MSIKPKSLLDGLSQQLSALKQANAIGGTTAEAGFKWPDWKDARTKVGEELAELDAALAAGESAEKLQDELGDLLFAVVSLSRYLKLDPEQALRQTNAKFARRFRYIEAQLQTQGRTPAESTLEEMHTLWEAAKQQE